MAVQNAADDMIGNLRTTTPTAPVSVVAAPPVDRQYLRATGATASDWEFMDAVPNSQTGTAYTVLTGDRTKLVTFSNALPVAVVLPAAGASFPNGWFAYFENRGVGTATITPTTSTIDGAATLALTQNQGCLIASDGTNYFTMRGFSAATSTFTPIPFTDVTATSQAMAVNNGYVADNAGLVTLTLPVTAAFGVVMQVVGRAAGGWRIAQNAGQQIIFGNQSTTAGTGGRLDSLDRRDGVSIVCTAANTEFTVYASQGNINVT